MNRPSRLLTFALAAMLYACGQIPAPAQVAYTRVNGLPLRNTPPDTDSIPLQAAGSPTDDGVLRRVTIAKLKTTLGVLPAMSGNSGKYLTNNGSSSSWGTFTGAFSSLASLPTTLSGYGITDAQPLDADLTAIAGLTTTTFGRSLLTSSSAPYLLSLIGGQPFDADLTTWAGITPGTGWSTFLAGVKPTTLSGYGITDAQPLDPDLTTWAGITPGTGWSTVLAAAKPTTLSGYGITDAQPLDADLTTWAGITPGTGWSTILAAAKPTTLSGYGITDAQPLDPDLTTYAGITPSTIGQLLLAAANAGAARNGIGATGGIFPTSVGGTGTATPGLIAGTNVTITGTWPNQTVNSTGGGFTSTSISSLTAEPTPNPANDYLAFYDASVTDNRKVKISDLFAQASINGVTDPTSHYTATLDASHLTQNRSVTLADGPSVTVIPSAATSGSYVTGIGADGVLTTASTYSRQTFSNANVALVVTGTTVLAQTGTMTAAHTIAMPLAALYAAGTGFAVIDESGTLTSTNKLTANATGSDTINGATSADIITPYASVFFRSNGASKWTYDIQGIVRGGTGGTSATQARSNLGLTIGTNVEAWDADLDALAALTGTNTLYYRSAANTWTGVTIGSGLTFSGGTLAASGGGSIDDTAFASSWNGVTTTGPSKNAVYDIIHAFDTDDDGKVNVLDLGAGIVKTDSSGNVSLATAGTDYYAPGSTDVALADGGTGASTLSGAQANLGIAVTSATSAGKPWPLFADASAANGANVALQSAIWNKMIVSWGPSATAGGNAFGAPVSNQGTGATATLATTNAYTTSRRTGYASVVTTANQTVGLFGTDAMFLRGGTANQGGFFFVCRFGTEAWTTGDRLFVGLTPTAGASILSSDPSAMVNACGFGIDAADSAITFMHNDGTGTATKETFTGPTLAAGQGYIAYIYAKPNDSTLYYRLDDMNAGTTLVDSSVTTDLPGSTTFLRTSASAGNAANTAATAAQIGINLLYVESNH